MCIRDRLPAGAVAGWGLHPLESAAFSRRTPQADISPIRSNPSHEPPDDQNNQDDIVDTNVAVSDLGSPESRIGFTILPHPEFGLLNSYRTLACGTRGTRTIEHDGTGGAELPFVLDKTEGHAALIRDCLLAKPHRSQRASICILLCIGDCRGRACDHHDNESNGAQFTHGVALQFGAWSDNDWSRSLFPYPRKQTFPNAVSRYALCRFCCRSRRSEE